jgi:hypothetical protein
MKNVFITHLNTVSSKVFLTLKIMDFENVMSNGVSKIQNFKL